MSNQCKNGAIRYLSISLHHSAEEGTFVLDMGQVGILELLEHGARSFALELFQCIEGAVVEFFVYHKTWIKVTFKTVKIIRNMC